MSITCFTKIKTNTSYITCTFFQLTFQVIKGFGQFSSVQEHSTTSLTLSQPEIYLIANVLCNFHPSYLMHFLFIFIFQIIYKRWSQQETNFHYQMHFKRFILFFLMKFAL